MIWPFLNRRERLRRAASRWVARMDGAPGAADHAAFRRWYQADPGHAEAFERVRARSAGPVVRQVAGIEGESLESAVPRRRAASDYGLAAGVAICLLAGALLLLRPSQDPARGQPTEMLFLATDVGEIRSVALGDGSRLTLDSQTEVEVELGKRERRARVRRGRARFAVAADEQRLFVVDAGAGRISAAGGIFEVSLDAGNALVRPIEGTLAVASAKTGQAFRDRLAPGEVVRIGASGSARFAAGTSAGTLWPTGMLDFDGTPLGAVLAEANRYSSTQLGVAEPALAALEVTGTFRAGDNEGLARSLATAFGLHLRRSKEGFILSRGSSSASEAKTQPR